MDIVYIRLDNGDEIFGQFVGEQDGIVFLDNVLCMETISNDDAVKYLFLTRYIPYSDDHSLSVSRDRIIFMKKPKTQAQNHYQTSLTYAEEISDIKFGDGMSDASKYLNQVIEKNRNRKSVVKEETFETVADRVLGKFETDRNTKH